MKAHLDAIKAELAPLGYTVHLGSVPTISSQYLVINAATWSGPLERPTGTTDAGISATFRVMAVTGTPQGVLTMLERVRSILGPENSWPRLAVPGRYAVTHYEGLEATYADRDVTITNTDRHPEIGVDTYRLVSEPA